MGMWTRIALWAGLMALVTAAAASAQAVVPQYTHRGYVGDVAFDAGDARVAVTSSGGFVSILDVASGRVLAVRRLLRSNEAGFLQTELDGPLLRTMATFAGDEPEALTWNWVEDTLASEARSWDEVSEDDGPDNPNEVVGRGARAVNGSGSAELHREGEEPVTVGGRVEWIGARSALVRRDGGLVRLRLRDLSERQVVRDGVDQVWVGARGVILFRTDDADRFTLVRRNGRRQSYVAGGEHSVWHVHAAPSGESVVLAGRFGIQRWTAEGVVDGSCDGEELMAVDWGRGLAYSRWGRCTRRGARRDYPGNAMAMASTADGTTLLLSNGRFFGRRRPRARVRDLAEAQCEDGGYCAWYARFAAKGELLLIEQNPDWEEGTENRVIRTRTGRDLFRVPSGRTFAVAADGSRIAVLHGGGGTVRDDQGEVLFAFGTEAPDDDQRSPLVAFSADGQRFAWATEDTLNVLDVDGHLEQQLELDGRPSFLLLTEDGIGYGDGGGTVIRQGALTHHEASGVTPTGAACVEGHFRTLEADLSVTRGPACSGGTAERRGDLYFRKMGGAVRLWQGDRVMTLRAIRRIGRVTPMAYTADGRWWTRDAANVEESAAPIALRTGLGSASMAQPADPALLEALFAGR